MHSLHLVHASSSRSCLDVKWSAVIDGSRMLQHLLLCGRCENHERGCYDVDVLREWDEGNAERKRNQAVEQCHVLGIRGKAIISPYAELGMDVDKPHQLALVRRILASRGTL